MFKPANNVPIDLTSSNDYCRRIIENFIWSTTEIEGKPVSLDIPNGYRYIEYKERYQRVIIVKNV